jgi:transmembrane sensor
VRLAGSGRAGSCGAGSCGAEIRAGFEAWRAQSVEHAIAFEREAAVWERLDRLRALRSPQPPIAPSIAPPIAPARPRARRWALAAAGLAAVIGLNLAPLAPLSSARAYATGVGERQRVVLEDGTTIELNTDSRIEVRYARNLRQVRLVRGEVMFHIANDRRPFSVQTPSARLDASAADFSVRLTPAGARVTVSRGAALASETNPTGGAPKSLVLAADSQAVLAPRGAQVNRLSGDELQRLLAWRQGAIELNGETLSEAAAEFNRYSARRIVIADAGVAGLHVGGYFRADDADGFVRAVTRTFPVRIAAATNERIVLTAASAPAGR